MIAIRSGLLGRRASIRCLKTGYAAVEPMARALRFPRPMIGRSEDLLGECRAAESGQQKSAQILVMFGADKTATNREGQTPAELATTKGHHAIVEILR